MLFGIQSIYFTNIIAIKSEIKSIKQLNNDENPSFYLILLFSPSGGLTSKINHFCASAKQTNFYLFWNFGHM